MKRTLKYVAFSSGAISADALHCKMWSDEITKKALANSADPDKTPHDTAKKSLANSVDPDETPHDAAELPHERDLYKSKIVPKNISPDSQNSRTRLNVYKFPTVPRNAVSDFKLFTLEHLEM
ncbi:hypothetical protein DPMN_112820 [Dreissena polymorpha]|uniref:Uncharacterized protein n=1 Tax=Dreissena polymorpha TaxID=45954 RepID=A0A9D4KGC7_DREPO|nr:hypothetical protein DPMN_112820 [Dreissena polymorpha]